LKPSTHIFQGGRIISHDPAVGEPEALVIEDGRIAAVGERELGRAYPDAIEIDLAGRTLLPGFIDAHNHLSVAALQPLWADVSGVADLDALKSVLQRQAALEPQAHWVRACLWDESHNGLFLDRHALDALDIDRPVIVAHFSLHQCAVNTRALDELGIGRNSVPPPGGLIARDPEGSPSGLLIERAWSQAHARSMAAYHDRERWADLFEARMRQLLRDGITAVHDAACSPAAEEVYATLRRAGRMRISVLTMPHADSILARLDRNRLDGPPTGEGDELLRVGAIKLFADGGTQPAIQLTMGGQRGEPFGLEFPGLAEDVAAVLERGFRVAVHAIGNLGVTAALRSFSGAAKRHGDGDHRWRIEHACLASRQQIAEMAARGVVGVVQPGFVDHLGRLVEGLRSEEESWLPFGEMQLAGVRLAASSDDPCAFHQPLRTSTHGATRRTGSGGILDAAQSIGYEEWLRLYSAGAAYAGGQEHERGSLSPGKRADLVVLAGRLDPDDPPKVVETWVGGVREFP
jgi:predicted amidohydrolase YtcJ